MSNWASEADRLLRELWNDGLSAKLIAEALHDRLGVEVSRNAVIGRAHRLKVDGRPAPVGTPLPHGSGRLTEMKKLLSAGGTNREIGQRVGVRAITVSRWRRELVLTGLVERAVRPKRAHKPRTRPVARGAAPSRKAPPAMPRPRNATTGWVEYLIGCGAMLGRGAFRTCQFIAAHRGEPGWPDKCGGATVLGTAWCAAHLTLCTTEPNAERLRVIVARAGLARRVA